jgi:vancomycin permeability regulator SanA
MNTIRNAIKKLWKRKFYRCIFIVFGIFCLFLFTHILLISIDGLNDDIQTTDFALVLGNKVYRNGTVSPRLKSRLDKALELYEKGYFKYIIVSGGMGKEGYDEATAMKEYLLKHNVPEEAIIVDSSGFNTHYSAENTAKIMKERNWQSVMIISNYYHITRSRLALKQEGITDCSEAHAEYFEIRDLFSLFRETIAYYSYLLKY